MRKRINRTYIPWAMAAARAALGPVLIAGAACAWNRATLAGIVVAALFSDIYDGVLARRWHCDTPAVRLFDTLADTFFYLCTALAIWKTTPRVWRENGILLLLLIALEVARLTFDLAKFHRSASYHSYTAKAWGLLLAVAVVTLFALGHSNPFLPLALELGIVCQLEGLAMSLILPRWRRDVKTLPRAWQLRREMLIAVSPATRRRAFAWFPSALLLLVVVLSHAAHALQPSEVKYVGGTGKLTPGSEATLDLSSPTVLSFQPKPAGSSLLIPYTRLLCYQYGTEVAHHVGVLPAIAVSLVKKRERRHFLTIDYTGDDNATEIMVLEIPKDAPRTLVPIFQAKSRKCMPAVPSPHLTLGRNP